MECPKCSLINPQTAQRCDCGYDFESGTMKRPYLSSEEREKVSLSWRYGPLALIVAGIVWVLKEVSESIAGHALGRWPWIAWLVLGVFFSVAVSKLVRDFALGNYEEESDPEEEAFREALRKANAGPEDPRLAADEEQQNRQAGTKQLSDERL